MSVSHFPCTAGVLEGLQMMCMYTPLLLSLSLFFAAYQWLCIAPGLCLIAPPLPFFSTLNEA